MAEWKNVPIKKRNCGTGFLKSVQGRENRSVSLTSRGINF